MIRSLSFLIATLALSLSPRLAAQDWQWQNPTPHGLSVNDVVMMDEYWAFAACDNGHIMRSGDGGRTWETRLFTTENLRRVACTDDGSIVIIGDRETILRSENHGMDWTMVMQGSQNSSTFHDLVRIGGNSLLAVLGGLRLVRSDDGGRTWTDILFDFTGNEYLRSLAVQSPTSWWATTNRRVYRSTNEGTFWQEESRFEAAYLQRFVFVDSLYGYQLRQGQVLQTHDGGYTWKEMDIFGFDYNLRLEAGARLGDAVFCLSDGNYIVNKSSDAGASWNISLTGAAFPESYPNAMSFASSTVGLVTGEGGRILRTEDGGLTWNIVHGFGYLGPISDLVFMTPQNGFACSYAHTALITTNGGRRWDETVPHPDWSLRKVHFFSEHEGYAYASNIDNLAAVFHTTDRGLTWAFRSRLPITYDIFQPDQPQSILALSRDTVMVGSSYGKLFRSIDAAQTWDTIYVSDQLQQDYSTGIALIAFRPSTLIYVSAYGIGSSTDGGSTWRYNGQFGSRQISQAQFFDPQTGVALLSGTFATTSDGGAQWNLSSHSGFELLHFFDGRQGIGFSSRYQFTPSGDIRTTSDSGATWEEHSIHERVDWSGWYFISPQEGWVYGYGGAIRHNNTGGLVHAQEALPSPASVHLEALYPNPFVLTRDGALSVRFTLPAEARAAITITDLLGREVASVLDKRLNAGAHIATIPAGMLSGCPAGSYFLKLRAGAGSVTRGVVVVR